jgi:hypothetical protein
MPAMGSVEAILDVTLAALRASKGQSISAPFQANDTLYSGSNLMEEVKVKSVLSVSVAEG